VRRFLLLLPVLTLKPHPSFYFGHTNLIDLLSFLPVFITIFGSGPGLAGAWLRILSTVRSLRLLRAWPLITRVQKDHVRLKLLSIAYSFVCIVFIASCVVFRIDIEFSVEREIAAFHIAVYWFTCLTVTVAFGDVIPGSLVARFVTSLILVTMWLVMSINLAKLIVLITNGRDFRGEVNLRGRRQHIVIGGFVNFDSLLRMLREVFDRTRSGNIDHDVAVVVVLPSLPSPELIALASNPHCQHRMQLAVGSLLFEDDLERMHVRTADAVFILTDKGAADVAAVDMSVVLQALAVADYAPDLREHLYVQVMRSSSKHHLLLAGISNVVPIEGLKYNLIGQTGGAHGLTTLVAHLLHSHSQSLVPRGVSDVTQLDGWKREYVHGAWQQLRAVSLAQYAGHQIGHVTAGIFLANGAVLFAINSEVRNRRRIVVKPPLQRIVRDTDIGFFIVLGTLFNITHSASDVKDEILARGFNEFEAEKKRFGEQVRAREQSVRRNFAHLDTLNETVRSMSSARTADLEERDIVVQEPVFDVELDDDAEFEVAAVTAVAAPINSTPNHFRSVRRVDSCSDLDSDSADDEDSVLRGRQVRQPHGLIVVCGLLNDEVARVVNNLRDKRRQAETPIVIVAARQPESEDWRLISQRISAHHGITFVFADSLQYLASGAVAEARFVLVLQGDTTGTTQTMRDSDVIVMARAISSQYPTMFVLAELIEARNIEVMCTGRRLSERGVRDSAMKVDLSAVPASYFFEPHYAAGHIFADAIFDTLVGQMFFNLCTHALIKLLIGSGRQPQIFLIDCPASLTENDSVSVFQYLLVRGYLMLGIYRRAGHLGAEMPFVFANPPPGTMLYARDKIFIIADREPNAGEL
jgi:voltage-gated potassium channel Kch